MDVETSPTTSRRHTAEEVPDKQDTTSLHTTSPTTNLPISSASNAHGAEISTSLETTPVREASHAPASSSFGPNPPQPVGRGVDLSGVRRKVARSFTWKMTAKGKQLASQLCQACEENDPEWVKNLLEQGAYVNGYSTSGPTKQKTPLILAIEHDAVDIVAILLQDGADLDTSGTDKKPPLSLEFERVVASKHRTFEILELFLSSGSNVNATFNDRTLLSNAVSQSRTDLVDFLLRHGASAKDHRLIKEAMMVNGGESLEIATSLLQAGAPAGPDPNHSFYPLKHAIFDMGSLPWVKLLITHGANPTIVYKGTVLLTRRNALLRPTPLHLVLETPNHGPILEFILSRNVNVNAECTYSRSGESPLEFSRVVPLHRAKTAHDVHSLIRHGANVLSRDSRGETPLFWRVHSGSVDSKVIQALIQHGTPPNARNAAGDTPLYLLFRRLFAQTVEDRGRCTTQSFYDSVKLLLEAGARVDVRGHENWTVLDLVTKKKPELYDKILPDDIEPPKAGGMRSRQMYDEICTMVLDSARKNTRVEDSPPKLATTTNEPTSPSRSQTMTRTIRGNLTSGESRSPANSTMVTRPRPVSLTASAKAKPSSNNSRPQKADVEATVSSNESKNEKRPKSDQPSKGNVNSPPRIEEFDMKSEYNVF